MVSSAPCWCGRRRATAEDLERWCASILSRPLEPHPAPLPVTELWASALCWTGSGHRCNMRRRWASDLHIGLAREVFAAYVADLEDFQSGHGPLAWALS